MNACYGALLFGAFCDLCGEEQEKGVRFGTDEGEIVEKVVLGVAEVFKCS